MSYKHDKRVFEFIRDNPNNDAVDVAKELEIPYASVRYSVSRLIEAELIFRYKRQLKPWPGVSEYVETLSKKDVLGLKTPRAFLRKDTVEDWEDLVSLGQMAIRVKTSGRDLNTTTIPYSTQTFSQFFDQLKTLWLDLGEPQTLLFHRMILIQQLLDGNFDFFSIFPLVGYPVEATSIGIIKHLKGRIEQEKKK